MRIGRAGKHAKAYKDKKQKMAETCMAAMLMPHVPPAPAQGPVDIEIMAYLPVPKSWSKKKQAAALAGDLRPDKKPDIDNLVKNLFDVMTQMQFWQDDVQVCDLWITKRYAERPRWDVRLAWGEDG